MRFFVCILSVVLLIIYCNEADSTGANECAETTTESCHWSDCGGLGGMCVATCGPHNCIGHLKIHFKIKKCVQSSNPNHWCNEGDYVTEYIHYGCACFETGHSCYRWAWFPGEPTSGFCEISWERNIKVECIVEETKVRSADWEHNGGGTDCS